MGNADRESNKMNSFVVKSLRQWRYRRGGQRPAKRRSKSDETSAVVPKQDGQQRSWFQPYKELSSHAGLWHADHTSPIALARERRQDHLNPLRSDAGVVGQEVES